MPRLHTGFTKSVRDFPNNAALLLGGQRTWSYAEIDSDARKWAAALQAGCTKGTPKRIAVFAEKGYPAYVGILAALFSGAAFVPLNPKHPSARIVRILERAAADAIITDAATLPLLRTLLPHLSVLPQVVLIPNGDAASFDLDVPAMGKKELNAAPPLPAPVFGKPDEMAYLMFTSGSTGEPKGVPITHANAAHFLEGNQQRYQFTPRDRFTQFSELTFDMAIFDLFMAWGCGGCSCVMEPIQIVAPGEFLRQNEITVWFSVPSLVTLLSRRNASRQQTFPTLRWSLFCGEPLTWAAAQTWQKFAPNSTIENLYGPTELTVACSVYSCDGSSAADAAQDTEATVPIGKMYEGLSHVLTDEEGRPVGEGKIGELCVAGPQTFPGYWNDADKTAKQMITLPDPLTGLEHPYYRTGDRVRLRDDGNYVFLGRADLQVKVRGHRIELNEIEAALLQNEGVTEAVALPWPVENGVALGLVAFVSGSDVDVEQIAKQIKGRLPDYMIPQRIHPLDLMPLNANGKIDRKRLAAFLENPA